MCNPVLIQAGIAVGGALMQADQQRQQGKVESQAAKDAARMADVQAQQANADATRALEQQRWKTRAAMGQQRAGFAARNLDASLGTPLELLGQTAMLGAMDEQAIRVDAARKAWGYQAQQMDAANQGELARWGANQKVAGTVLGALGSASNMMGKKAAKTTNINNNILRNKKSSYINTMKSSGFSTTKVGG